MIFSSRNITQWREQVLAITGEQWLLLATGLVLGAVVWFLFNRRIVRRMVARLKERSMRGNIIALAEGLVGAAVLVVNVTLAYLATLMASFFLFALALPGLAMGVWITIPADHE